MQICYTSGIYQLVKQDTIVMWMLSPGEHVQPSIRQDCLNHVFGRRFIHGLSMHCEKTKSRYSTDRGIIGHDKPVLNMTLFEFLKRGSLHANHDVVVRKKTATSLRVKERHGDRTGTVKGSYLKNNIKFVCVLWDGDVDVCDEKHCTSESVVNICVKKSNTPKTAVPLKPDDEVHVEHKSKRCCHTKTLDLSKVSDLAAQYYLNPQTYV